MSEEVKKKNINLERTLYLFSLLFSWQKCITWHKYAMGARGRT